MRINKPYILIRINKDERTEKQQKIGSIYLAPAFIGMERNMQCGIVEQIGEYAQKHYPEIQPGDTVFFDHGIESDPNRLIDKDSTGNEYRYIDCRKDHLKNKNYEIFGTQKRDGAIIPASYYIFCEKSSKPIKKEVITSLITVDNEMWDDEDLIRVKLDNLQANKKSLEESMTCCTDPYEFERIEKERDNIERERGRITAYLNAQRFIYTTVTHIHPEMGRLLDVQPGDKIIAVNGTLYPLDTADKSFYLAFAEEVVGRFNRELAEVA
jgi:hypothetical protein